MAAKRKPAPAQSQFDFPARTPRIGDRVHRKGWQSTYVILKISHDGACVNLCLLHGGQPTNLEHPHVPVAELIWIEAQ